ncbi:hypothetical protein SVIO_019760 [Streptomyces violaceusniger]|uniref:Uncharacterized protein n=2 Tax=Streptomyces violaceusniger TaxID=68280 RepID=A0A4D4L012_STRVO|nr:hypothetical protein SVIO_019760 [Streptomyces violaceusniger]
MGRALRCIPPTARWQLPPKHILRAVERLGPGSRPSPYKLRRNAAILDSGDAAGARPCTAGLHGGGGS